MGNLDPRLTRSLAIYLGLLAAVVLAAQLGVVPGSHDRPANDAAGLFGHPYRLAMVAVVVAFAIGLGTLAAWAGVALRAWHLGLAALIVGGVVTGGVLAFAPYILFTQDQYPVTFSWVLLGAPIGFLTWLGCSLVHRASDASATA
ncbi:MAG: hypothetical protein GKS06_14200 [Acidobacteria bacterium]|nr:hypothetical protein [Acidobacteriota bacterium]